MGFKEAFTRGGESEKNLIFDDEAFFYFAISILMIMVIPLSYIVLSVLIKNLVFNSEAKKLNRISSGEHDKEIAEKVKRQKKYAWLNFGFIVKVGRRVGLK